jgi:hypothetical protein
MKVDDKEISFSETFIVRNDETIQFQHTILGSRITVVLRFTGYKYPAEPAEYSWSITGDTITVEFKNWANPNGTATTNPIKIGDINGHPFGFVAAHHMIAANIHLLHFQLLTGGSYDQR